MEDKRIGLYGGTFSPPHKGHVNAAENFVRALDLDKLYVMPANIPPHKEVRNPVSPSLRLEMCRRAFAGVENAVVSDYEITKSGVSYTYETLDFLSKESCDIYMLCGDDMFLTLDTWRRGDDILRSTHIVCMRRYDTDGAELLSKKKEYEEKYAASVTFIDSLPIPVSSTEIREMIRSGDGEAERYLDGGVLEFINENGLYTECTG